MKEYKKLNYIEGSEQVLSFNFRDSNGALLDLSEKLLTFEVLRNGRVIIAEDVGGRNPYSAEIRYLRSGKYSYRIVSYRDRRIVSFGRMEIIPSLHKQ